VNFFDADAPLATDTPECVVINLPMPITTNNLFFNGSGRTGRVRTPEYNAWIKEAGLVMLSQRPKRIKGPVTLLLEVSDSESTTSWDLSNRLKAVEDLLCSHYVIQGDSKKYVREIAMRWADVAGVRVTITPCE
jgi:crossover junction endodeoxyribonuclease RusA